MQLTKYLIFTTLSVTILTSCASTTNQDRVSNMDYKEHDEISLKQYENVENYNSKLKRLQYSSGLKNIPREILDAQVKIKEISKDNTIDNSEYRELNIEHNLKKYTFMVKKLLKIEQFNH